MKIYQPRPAEGCQWFGLGELVLELEEPLRSATPVEPALDLPLRLERIASDDGGNALAPVPLPWVTSLAPCVVAARSAEFFTALAPDAVEPLDCVADDGEPFTLVHVLEEREAINVEKSDLVRYSSGAIMRVRRLEVNRDQVGGATIFRDPRLRTMFFVTDVVIDALARYNLYGWSPELLWDSDASE